MQDTLSSLHKCLDHVRALFDTNVPQSPPEKDFRDSIDQTLEVIRQDLLLLTGKLHIDVILEAKGSKRLEAWYVLQRKFQSDDIRSIKERLAWSKETLLIHFLVLSLHISCKARDDDCKTRDEVTDLKAFSRPILETLLNHAILTEKRQRSQVAESRSIRQLQYAANTHGASNTFPEEESDLNYHNAFKRWRDKSEHMIADVPWHQVSNSNYVPSILNESRDGASIVPTVLELEETDGLSPSSRLGSGLPRVEEIPDEPPEDVTEELIDWCKEQGYPVQASNFRCDLICQMAPSALKGTAPIHHAIKTNNMTVLEKMLSQKSNKEVRLEDGSQDLTPFLLACSELKADAVKILLAKGAKADATDSKGQTGLHLCQSSKFAGRRVAKRLLEDPRAVALDVNAQDQFGMTATHIAARVGDVKMLEYLLLDQHGKKVADANAQQQDGSTPLIVAMKSNISNKKQVLEVLLRYSDLSIKNKNGEDAKKVAPKEEVFK
ncbi:ankyrin repeat [Fusarium pseudoanthophilum]|uniref:Ankyrin repeat n=1 Tax=Fusarium pseudoanthophilum TaxID=48495 RepID=A0A8H5KN68_9HYPO|nr:ankyrin repeat [Fusarium pseudoanthophilum]